MPFASGNSYTVKARNILYTMFKKWVSLVLLLVLATCITLLIAPSVGLAANLPNIWHPKPGATWYWQLSETVDTSVSAEVYDVDLFDNTKQLSDELHEKGHKVICYVNIGHMKIGVKIATNLLLTDKNLNPMGVTLIEI